MESFRQRLLEPRDAASLAAFRILFGLLLFGSTVRFLINGWVQRFYVEPTFFFKYWGLEWVEVLPEPWMTALHVLTAVLALFVAVGFLYRLSAVLLFFVFTYIELIDVTNYLNHYYLVSLIALLMCIVPMHRAYSVDSLLWRHRHGASVPAWMLYLVRFQVAVVYVFAGLAKLQPDWLIHAQPLGIWLASRTETPIIGALLGLPAMPLLMSWAGFLNDTFVVPFLLWKKTRPFAYMVLLVFHFGTHLLFVIGLFPFLMVTAATVFFEPDWPRRLGAFARRVAGRDAVPAPQRESTPATFRWSTPVAVVVGLFCVLQVGTPLRSHLYPGDVLWHEQGMRYAWRVMVREKDGSITYRVRWKGAPREVHVPPSQYLTNHQEREMSGQPDLILQLAHHIARDFEAKGHEDVEVRVDALVAYNRRRAALMIDPTVDLTTRSDGVHVADWILPRPAVDPRPASPTPQGAALFSRGFLR